MTSNFFGPGGAALTADRDDWETPTDLFNRLNEVFKFTLDAASNDNNAKCEKHFTQEQDGLKQSWGGETVFCNPPYGRQISDWIDKAISEKDNASGIVMLIPARTDTKWFHKIKESGALIEFIKGRLKYEIGGQKTQSAPFPSMLVYWIR